MPRSPAFSAFVLTALGFTVVALGASACQSQPAQATGTTRTVSDSGAREPSQTTDEIEPTAPSVDAARSDPSADGATSRDDVATLDDSEATADGSDSEQTLPAHDSSVPDDLPTASDPPADAGQTDPFVPDDAGPAEPALSAQGELLIPMLLQTESSVMMLLEQADAGLAPTQMPQLTFAIDDSFPDTVALNLRGSIVFAEDGSFLPSTDGDLRLTAVTSLTEEVAVSLLDAERFAVTVPEVGDYSIVLEGTWSTDDSAAVEVWSTEVEVRGRTIASIGWRACGEAPPYVLSGMGFKTSALQLFSAEGEQLSAVNTNGGRPVDILVQAEAETQLTTIDGLAQLVAAGPRQTVSLSTPLGALDSFELIGPADVEGMMLRYDLCAPWTRGSSLDSGNDYVGSFDSGQTGEISVHPTFYVGSSLVCSPVPADALQLSSSTPESCPITSELSCTLGSDSALVQGAQVLGPGACAFTVSGPTLSGGNGISTEFAVRFNSPMP